MVKQTITYLALKLTFKGFFIALYKKYLFDLQLVTIYFYFMFGITESITTFVRQLRHKNNKNKIYENLQFNIKRN